jgi:hypothetical protein
MENGLCVTIYIANFHLTVLVSNMFDDPRMGKIWKRALVFVCVSLAIKPQLVMGWAREFDFTIWDGFLLSLYLFFCECCLLHWLISNAWQRENNPFGINWELCILRSTNDAVLDEMKKAYMVEQEGKEKNQ